MSDWKVHLRPSWAKPDAPAEEVSVADVREVFDGYPGISLQLVRDLRDLGKVHKNYLLEMALEDIVGRGTTIDPENWIFVWAVDFRGRIFHLLFEREDERFLLAGAGPDAFFQFLREVGREALSPTLTLLTIPEKVRNVVVFLSKYKPPAYELERRYEKYKQVQGFIDKLKATPNVNGQWFPSFVPRCPVCNAPLVGLQDYRVGFGQIVCPRCGYKKIA
ncbi:MAG: hypothetical protein ACTSU5_04700 [Promethearchaeota archaeon]